MRFTAIFLTGALAAFASAETTTTALSPATSAQVAIVKCLDACPLGDVDCQSKCISVPNPNASMVNETNKCVAACPKGDGSTAQSNEYSKCSQDCIARYYWTPSSGAGSTAQPTDGSDSNNNNNSGNDSNNNNAPSGTSGNQASGTGSGAAAATKTDSAAGMVNAAGGGLLALVLGVLAL